MTNTPHPGTSPDSIGTLADFDSIPFPPGAMGDRTASLTKQQGNAFSLGLPRSQGRLDDARLTRVLAHIEYHLAEAMTVADLAKVACLSVFHFTRAFAAAMDVPPHRYVNGRRIHSAKELIATGATSLSEIAFDCRFSSQSSFTRAFKRATGITPAEYRRRLRIERMDLPDRVPRPCLMPGDLRTRTSSV
jgi:transcriptional regulator GlxA family with amidase domain